ncbi:MAG: mechanosensitive ion channel [Burkholderiales bacterium]|nr:mechanosensitive ion channel [Burkholderiales bacterium]
MTPRADSTAELLAWLQALTRPTALVELAAFAACLLAAWTVVRLVRGREPRPGSVWFGEGIVDGVLFPLLALALATVVRWIFIVYVPQVPQAVFKLVVPVLLSLAVIRLIVRVLGKTYPDSSVMRVVEHSVSWIAWIAVVLWLTGVLPVLLNELDDIKWKFGGETLSVRNMLEGAVVSVVVLVLALWLSATVEARLLKGPTVDIGVRKMAANALRALLLFIGLMFVLSTAGINLTALGVLGGALGVGIGFGLQKLAANYVSGFVILAERSMRIGDMVKVDNFEGRITDISTRYTVIRALNGREAIVPNEMMITQRVENSSLADTKVAVNTVVQVAYGSDVESLIPRLVAAVKDVPRVLAEPTPGVNLTAFAPDGLELTVGFWVAEPEMQGPARSDVNLAILRTLNEAQVEIPFPQRVVRQA